MSSPQAASPPTSARWGRRRALGSWSTADEVLNFTSNDYLGLAGDARLVEAAKSAVDQYGGRSWCGTHDRRHHATAR